MATQTTDAQTIVLAELYADWLSGFRDRQRYAPKLAERPSDEQLVGVLMSDFMRYLDSPDGREATRRASDAYWTANHERQEVA